MVNVLLKNRCISAAPALVASINVFLSMCKDSEPCFRRGDEPEFLPLYSGDDRPATFGLSGELALYSQTVQEQHCLTLYKTPPSLFDAWQQLLI
jgi:hypothetical protein